MMWQLTVLQCPECRLVFLDQTEALASARSFNDLWWEQLWGPVLAEQSEEMRATALMKCEWLERHLPDRGRLLDVGCGEGTFLAVAKARGWDVTGVEGAEIAARRARARIGEGVVFGNLEATQFPSHTFDAVTLWDVLEHVMDPLNTLRGLARVLRPGGVVIISTPNAQSALHRLSHYSYHLSFRRLTFALRRIYFPVHLYYFDPSTLTRTLRLAGFTQLRFQTDLKAPGGLFDNLDALFIANQQDRWTRLPFLKPAIAGMLWFSQWLGQPYRLLVLAHTQSEEDTG